MAELEKVIKAVECRANGNGQQACIVGWDVDCPYSYNHAFCDMNQLLLDALDLLREQEDLGTELTNAVELIHKKNERIEKLLKEQEAVVHCKDCKHGEIHGIDVECVAHEEVSYDPEPWHPLDWFCADGERAENAR